MADMPEIPDVSNIADMTDEELASLADTIQAAAVPIAEAAATGDPAATDTVTKLADAFQLVQGELANRVQAQSDAAARSAEALAILGTDDETEGPGDPDAATEDAAQADEGDAAGMTNSDTATATADIATATITVTPVLDAEALAAIGDQVTDTIETAAAAATATLNTPPQDAAATPPAAAPTQEDTVADQPTTDEDTAALNMDATAGEAATALAVLTPEIVTELPAPTQFATLEATTVDPRIPMQLRPARARYQREYSTEQAARFEDTGAGHEADRGKVATREHMGTAFARKFDQVKGSPLKPIGEGKIYLAHAEALGYDRPLGTDPVANARILRDTQRAVQGEMTAVVASGGNCAIPTNNYDVFNAATEQSPVEGFLRGIGADRGGMRYLSAPDWVNAQAGVQVTTNEEDAAGYTNQTPPGPTTPKVCVHFDCPEELECQVDAVSACASFGNLTYRTAPELVEVLLDQLAVAHAQAKEITYLDAIQAGSTDVNYAVTAYGAFRTAVYAIAVAAQGYRKRNHIGRTMPLDVLAPDSMIPVLKSDMVTDYALGANFVAADQEALAAELFAALNLNVEFYYDYSTTYGAARAMQDPQTAGALNLPPTDFRLYMYAPGTWVRLDGGTLDVGLVRDSTLNSQNDLQLFSEEWVQACKVGFESIRLDLTLCASGVGPAGTDTPLTCRS